MGEDSETVFSRVPEEIWEEILLQTEWPPEALLELALMSRHFYNLCLTLYLRSVNASLDLDEQIKFTVEAGTHPRHDVLTVLQLPFSQGGGTRSFHCTITGKGPVESMQNLRHHLQRLQRGINNLGYVHKFSVTFKHFEKIQDPKDTSLLEETTRILGLLLNSLVAEKGCKSIEIHGLDNFGHLFYRRIFRHSKRTPKPDASTKALEQPITSHEVPEHEDIISGPHWNFKRVSSPSDSTTITTSLSPAARRHTTLQHLFISSDALAFFPPLFQWVYSALLVSPIQSIGLSTYRWTIVSTILPKTVPDLKRLDIKQPTDCLPKEFIHWLEHSFKQLTSLTIRFPTGNWMTNQPEVCPTFLNLTELKTGARWFSLWFKAWTQTLPDVMDVVTTNEQPPNPFHHPCLPRLQDLTIFFNHRLIQPTDSGTNLVDILKSLAGLHRHCQLPFAITYHFQDSNPIETIASSWFRSGQAKYYMPDSNQSAIPISWSDCFSKVILEDPDGPPDSIANQGFSYLLSFLQEFRAMTSLVVTNIVKDAWPKTMLGVIRKDTIEKLKYFEVDGVDRTAQVKEPPKPPSWKHPLWMSQVNFPDISNAQTSM